jgi:diaminohydroxyphosphoribosylaminopyrimidine deaminase / 5-amino-6-(5-phosphoribosylamino)uracil reductase
MQLKADEYYMQRCIDLAQSGAGNVAPNPMVGAVLVHEGKIIGEGYHQQYGKAHAEVNCINSVKEEDAHLIQQSTIYVSLEPCAHWGKTPPCANLIIDKKIPRVVVGCRDPFEAVNGKGIEKITAAGIDITMNILEEECKKLNKRFFTFHTKKRPYIILKWAQTADGKIAAAGEDRLRISNDITNRLVHKWRSEEAAILVGTTTALLDNPQLNNRLWSGNSPVRLVLDKALRLPPSLHLFDQQIKTVVLNMVEQKEEENLVYFKMDTAQSIADSICKACYALNIQSVLIEGGAQLLQTFIQHSLWDEARIITNRQLYVGRGLYAPALINPLLEALEQLGEDRIDYFSNTNN